MIVVWCNVRIKCCVSAAKVGKTSLIMSLVSEEFPDEVCTKSQSDGRRGWNCGRGSLFSVWMILPRSFRFHSALRRSPSQLMSPQRGSPHTLWTTQVNYTHAMKWMLLKQEHVVLHKDLPLLPPPEAEQSEEQLYQEISKVDSCTFLWPAHFACAWKTLIAPFSCRQMLSV